MLESCRDVLREERAPDIDALMANVPSGYFLGDPSSRRVSDLSNAIELYDQSYQAWTQSYRSDAPRVSEEHSTRTAELGQAIARTATFLNANYERYEEALVDMEIPRETLEAQGRSLDVETSHHRARSQDQEMGAMRT